MFSTTYNFLKAHRFLAAALAVTLVVYARFLFFGHISWDDPEMVFKNKAVRDFDLKGLFTHHYVGNYIPVTMLVHAISWQLFDNSDGLHHLVNILFHLFNGALVYAIGRRLFKNDTVANTGAIIFLLHPLQIESVGWISELKNVLSTTFYLLGMLYYIRFKENEERKKYALTLVFFLLGCLSKSSVVVFPLSLLCVDLLWHKSLSWKMLVNKIPFFAISFLFGYINIQTQTADLFINHSHEFRFYQRIGLAGFALINYLILFLLPVKLSVIYPYPDVKPAVIVLGFFALAAILAAAIILFRKKNITWLALICFVLVNLILVLQLLPFGEALYADRYLYVPLIGLAWMAGLLIAKIKIQPGIVSVILIILLSALTLAGSSRWKSAIVLYEDILKKYPDMFIALNSAGVESMFLNEDDKALAYFDKATETAPYNYKGFYNRGLLYLKNQKPDLAIKSFNQSLAIYPYNKALVGRASAYMMTGDISKAMSDAREVLASEPKNAKAHFVMGNCFNEINKLPEALQEYNTCIALSGEEPDFYFKRGIVYGKQQNFNACISDLTICLSFDPFYYEAHYWIGVAKVNLKQNPCEDLKIAAQHNYQPAVAAFNQYCR